MTDLGKLSEEIREHLQFYRELGIRWYDPNRPPGRYLRLPGSGEPERGQVASRPESIPASGTLSSPRSLFDPARGTLETLEQVREDLGDCTRCKLSPARRNIVFGVGNPRAELLFVGEAPGADEDEQGLPFVGRAGQLLTRIVEAIGMKREDVYICNILKCRPPGNRNPEPDEIAACEPFLFRQIDSVAPRVICALGAFGARTLLQTREPISKLRGKLIDYRGAKLMATFHPAYLLRNPNEKRKVWEDVRTIRDYLRAPTQP